MTMTAADPRLEIEQLVHAHQKGVWRYLRFLGASPVEAEDLTQEVFLEIWRKPFTQINDSATASYIRTVAKNRFLMLIRSSGRRPALIDIENAEHLFAEFAHEDDGDEHITALRKCLERLRGKAKRAVQLFYADGHSRASTAKVMGLKEDGVKTILRRSRESLRKCVEGSRS